MNNHPRVAWTFEFWCKQHDAALNRARYLAEAVEYLLADADHKENREFARNVLSQHYASDARVEDK
jgi:macrodomain Ter protein organizer (MatP/YcbG family)